MCQYNNINVNLHQYLKEKKTQTDYWKKKNKIKKDSRNQSTVAAIVHAQCKNTVYIYKGKKNTNRRLKKKVANENGTVDEQWKTLYEQCKTIVENENIVKFVVLI